MNLHTVELTTIATWISLLTLSASASAPQQPSDPRLEVPAARGWIPADPCESGTEIGALYPPHGKVRRVTWYQARAAKYRDGAPPMWEKRAVQVFDDEGHCVEFERWRSGIKELRRTSRSPAGSPRDFEESFEQQGLEPLWWEEIVCDREGRRLGRVRIPFTTFGSNPDPRTPIVARWTYDELGRCCREARYDDAGLPELVRRWSYDALGRVERITDHTSYRHQTEDIEYDAEGRIAARTLQVRGDPAVHRSEFAYDDHGRLLRTLETIDGAPMRNVAFVYGDGGKLVHRETVDAVLEGEPPRIEEAFDGIDRPRFRETYDAYGLLVRSIDWTYHDDARGNWTSKVCRIKFETSEYAERGETEHDVWRKIEYAD